MRMDTDVMLRLLHGELPESEARKVRSAINDDPKLATRLERLQRMEGLLKTSAAESFGPYFSDRVLGKIMSTVAASRTTFHESLQWVFLRLAAASLVIVVGLGLYNAVDSRESQLSSSTVEAVFGLPSTDLENLFYLQGI